MVIHIGFTGSRNGMNSVQKDKFCKLFNKATTDAGNVFFHHGDCKGADFDAHIMVHQMNPDVHVMIHPPDDERRVARSYRVMPYNFMTVYSSKEYKVRDRDIVDASSLLFATPKSFIRERYSGTWYTIGYAERNEKHVCIIYPDGKVVESGVFQ